MVIDSDAHINESLDELAERLDAPYRSRAPRLLQDTLGLTRILMEGRLYPDPRLRQRHSRNVQGKDLGGIHRGAADPVPGSTTWTPMASTCRSCTAASGSSLTTIRDTDFAVAIARALNDYYAHFCDTAPTRLAAVAALPAQDVPAAVEELRRAVVELGHVGGTVPPQVAGRELDDAALGPLFAEAARLDVPISVHWGNGVAPACGGHRALRHPLHGPRHRPSVRADDRDGRDRVRRRARRPPGAAGGLPRGRAAGGCRTGSSGWRSTTSGARRRCPG